MAEINKSQLDELVASMTTIVGEDNDASDMMDSMIQLLALPDDQFELLYAGVIQSFQQTLNNPNDKIALVQALNAAGGKAEDLQKAFGPVTEAIDDLAISSAKRDFLKEIIATLIGAISDTEGISKKQIPVAIELCHPDAKIPQYAHISDSGADVYALDDITIGPGETVLVPTGFKVALPPGYELQVRPKSGRTLKTKLRIANTPGTIDAGYRDEVGIIVENIDPPIRAIHPRIQRTTDKDGNVQTIEHFPVIEGDILYGQSYTIGKGEKFAQLVLAEVPKAAFYRVESIKSIDDEDRGGGFGSTDKI